MTSIAEKQFDPKSGKVFVFGSNLAGIHGAGAALQAFKSMGAVRGTGEGPMPFHAPFILRPGCYAIPTKDEKLFTLPIAEIKKYVDRFLDFATRNAQLEFFVTRIGCGLAGYRDADIAPLFIDAPPNCELPNGWEKDGFCHIT